MHFTRDGDPRADFRLDFTFRTEIRNPNTALLNTGPIMSLNDPDWNLRQYYSVDLVTTGKGRQQASSRRLVENVPVPPPNIGPKSTPNYDALANAAIANLPGFPGAKVFAGPRDDPFYIDLGSAFDLLTIRPGPPGNAGGGIDQIAGLNVLSIAVQLPISAVVRRECNVGDPSDAECVVGMWATTSRSSLPVRGAGQGNYAPPAYQPSDDDDDDDDRRQRPNGQAGRGDFSQVSRLSSPLVNELVIPFSRKDEFNASRPREDAQFLRFVQDPEPARLIRQLFNLDVPAAPRDDIVTIFLRGIPGLNQPPNVRPAEMMRVNLAVPVNGSPNRLGVLGGDNQGYPNGRRLVDDVVDITLRAAAGGTPLTPNFNRAPNNLLGDGVDTNDKPFLTTFPYVAPPHQGFDHQHHRQQPRS
jgi:hypothetical protein